MKDKLVAGIITAASIAPFCVLCLAGPVAIGSMLAGIFGWLGGAGALLTGAAMAATGLLVYRDVRRRRRLLQASGEGCCESPPASRQNFQPDASSTVERLSSVQTVNRP